MLREDLNELMQKKSTLGYLFLHRYKVKPSLKKKKKNNITLKHTGVYFLKGAVADEERYFPTSFLESLNPIISLRMLLLGSRNHLGQPFIGESIEAPMAE